MTTNLEEFRDYCRRMARQDPTEPLWPRLADEVDAYLEDTEDDPGEALFP